MIRAALSRLWPSASWATPTVSTPDAGYRGARRDRRPTRNWNPSPGSANADLLADLTTLRARSRDMARNVMVAAGAINTVTTNVVGEGLVARPMIDRDALGLEEDAAADWEQRAAREWAHWCQSADMGGTLHFCDVQELAFRATLESGDLLLVRRFRADPGRAYGLRLALVEADRVSNPSRGPDTPTLKAGVEFDENGQILGYHVADQHPGDHGFVAGTTWGFLPRVGSDGRPLALHLMTHLRPDQARGVPYLAPVVESLKQLGDYTDAEVTAAVNAAMMVAFVESPQAMDDDGNPIIGELDEDSRVLKPEETYLENGATVHLFPGEKISIPQHGRPNANFDAFTMSFLRQTGVALELPFELLVKHFTASYSASRGALELAWQFFRKRRAWLVRSMCDPVYGWWLTEAVAAGRLPAPGFFDDPIVRAAWCGCQWIGPSRIILDPEKEANADRADVELGVKTRDQIITERTGGTWRRKHEQLAREAAARREAGLEAGAEGPADNAAVAFVEGQTAAAEAEREDADNADETEEDATEA